MQTDPSFLLDDSFDLFPYCIECCKARRKYLVAHEDTTKKLFFFDLDLDDRSLCLTILKSYGAAIESQLIENSADYLPGGNFHDGREEWEAKIVAINTKLQENATSPATLQSFKQKCIEFEGQINAFTLRDKKKKCSQSK